MLFYTVESALKVYDYIDPQLSSYEVKDNREDMEPMNLAEHGFQLIFGIADKGSKVMPLDPKFAKFSLVQYERIGGKMVEKEVPITSRNLS